ncbi:unnamed protein product [Rotaria sp. Silwood2]|nr:unnamed protein product [Rotaria sp. Silwood2]
MKLIPVIKCETCAYCRHLKKDGPLRRIYLGQGAYEMFDSVCMPWYYHPSCAVAHSKECNDPFNSLDIQALSGFKKKSEERFN